MKRKLWVVGGVLVVLLVLAISSFAMAETVVSNKKIGISNKSVTAGFSSQLIATGVDMGTETFKPVNNKYGIVTNTGLFTGKKKGSFKVTVNGAYNGSPVKKQKIKIAVKENTKTVNKKPDRRKGGVTMIPKKKYFKGNNFYIDFYVYNGISGRRITSLRKLLIYVVDRDTNGIVAAYGKAKLNMSIKSKKSKLVKIKFDKDIAIEKIYDLPNGGAERLSVQIMNAEVWGKGLTAKGAEMPGNEIQFAKLMK